MMRDAVQQSASLPYLPTSERVKGGVMSGGDLMLTLSLVGALHAGLSKDLMDYSSALCAL